MTNLSGSQRRPALTAWPLGLNLHNAHHLWTCLLEMGLYDPIHVNSEGQKVITERLIRDLRRILKSNFSDFMKEILYSPEVVIARGVYETRA